MADADPPKKVLCDYCELVGLPEYPCPGQDVHCEEQNRHCITTTHSCCLENIHDDHSKFCCSCKKEIPGG